MKKAVLLCFLSFSLKAQVTDNNLLLRFQEYIDAGNSHNYLVKEYKSFRRDTVLVWHGVRTGDGIISVYNPFSNWKQWDAYMNGYKHIDSIRYISSEHKITARFRETTDFLDQIGMSDGFEAIIHYWLDENEKVKEILYAWLPRDKNFDTHLKPVVDWAIKNDYVEIADLYLKNGFEPSWINGIRWQRILDAYNAHQKE